jgi:hypothetical protein
MNTTEETAWLTHPNPSPATICPGCTWARLLVCGSVSLPTGRDGTIEGGIVDTFLSVCKTLFLISLAGFFYSALVLKALQWQSSRARRKPRAIKHPSSPFLRRFKARRRLMKWIFWTERKKRLSHRSPLLSDGDVWVQEQRRWITTDPSLPPLATGWKPLKDMLYESGFLVAVFFSFFAIANNLDYFFPFLAPEFPVRENLLEVSGRLHFIGDNSDGGRSDYFIITQNHYGTNKVAIELKCQSGFFSVIDCSTKMIPQNGWSKTVARYHPQWGLIELVVDGYTVPNINYEYHEDFMKRSGRSAFYRAMASFTIIILYLARDCWRYRRRRAGYIAAAWRVKTNRKQFRN